MSRESLKNVSRIVVKLGTGVLTDSENKPDLAQMKQLVAQIAALRKSGKEVVLVTSGAVGAGMGVLGHTKRPGELAKMQACAAVGQSRLMAIYEKLFAEFKLNVAQVLLTHDDLQHRDRHLNARNTLIALLAHGVVPIINENDAISFTELKFGDNDKLSALVACLLPADLLVILTTVAGVIENFGKKNAKTISTVKQIDQELEQIAGGTASNTAVGGMASKVQAAKIVARAGIPLVIAFGGKKDVLAKILESKDEGTRFIPQSKKLPGRKRWIAFFHSPHGTVYVDDGCKEALRKRGKSLLSPGVTKCEGNFSAGEVIRVCDVNGTEFARGISFFNSEELKTLNLPPTAVIHRDNLVIL